ncbi:MAG TPA: sulfotransferase, partial [Anaerolineae bacterium]|nr:sulfotransferase [Anaerolineae bacterium]
MTQPSHIFIVGSYRSGTSILRQTLNRSNDVAICGETHFFCSPRTITSLLNYLSNRVEDVVTETRLTKNLPAGSWQDLSRVGDISTDAGAGRVVEYIYRDRPGIWS